MENKVLIKHIKGHKPVGKTNWSKVMIEANRPKIDEDNPDLVGKKQFRKVGKS